MEKVNQRCSREFFTDRFGEPADEYPTPSLLDEYIMYFHVPGEKNKIFWIMLDTKSNSYLYWSNEKMAQEKSGIRTEKIIPENKKVKKVTAWQQGENTGDTTIINIHEYNQKGQLITYSDPEGYCGINYTYDSIGRLASEDVMCGESSGNGLYTYSYEKGKHCIHFSGVMYDNISCEYTDNEGRITSSAWLRLTMNEDYVNSIISDSSASAFNYLYDEKKRVVSRIERSVSCYWMEHRKEGKDFSCEKKTETTFYTYDDADSIITEIKTDQTGKITDRFVYRYDTLFHQKTETYNFETDFLTPWKASPEDAISWFSHTVTDYCALKSKREERVYVFCREKTKEAYEEVSQIHFYQSGKIYLSLFYDSCSGKITDIQYYHYEFFE
ncbi:MAG: hypothetical protein ACOZCO_09300 [Bacteroidota bacterium]